jgi:protein gp37
MGATTGISWTEHTQNFWRGCTRVSPGCDRCYMFPGQKSKGLDPTRVIRTGAALWKQPRKWNEEVQAEGKRRHVFTCSWSDFFHPDADPWRAEAWQVIKDTPWLDYQILTKRPGRIPYSLPQDWSDGYPNVWLGVRIESPPFLWRIEMLKKISAHIRFLSLEPLLEPLGELDFSGIGWVIVGGESGSGFRPMLHAWARDIRDACVAQGVPFFFKQSAAFRSEQSTALQEEDGTFTVWRQYPENHDHTIVWTDARGQPWCTDCFPQDAA